MYLHIIKSYARILQKVKVTFLFVMNFLISFRICWTLKLPKYVTFSATTYNTIQ